MFVCVYACSIIFKASEISNRQQGINFKCKFCRNSDKQKLYAVLMSVKKVGCMKVEISLRAQLAKLKMFLYNKNYIILYIVDAFGWKSQSHWHIFKGLQIFILQICMSYITSSYLQSLCKASTKASKHSMVKRHFLTF